MDEVCDLIVNDTSIRVVDSAMSTNEKLWDLIRGNFALEEYTELGIRVEDVGNTLGWVETSNLDDVFACRPAQLNHLLLDAQVAELSHVVLGVPRREFLVQAVEPRERSVILLRWYKEL